MVDHYNLVGKQYFNLQYIIISVACLEELLNNYATAKIF